MVIPTEAGDQLPISPCKIVQRTTSHGDRTSSIASERQRPIGVSLITPRHTVNWVIILLPQGPVFRHAEAWPRQTMRRVEIPVLPTDSEVPVGRALTRSGFWVDVALVLGSRLETVGSDAIVIARVLVRVHVGSRERALLRGFRIPFVPWNGGGR